MIKAQVVNGYPPLHPDALQEYALIWHDMLDVIPTERLNEYFKRAFQAKTEPRPFAAKDVIACWNQDAERRAHEEALMGDYPPDGYSWWRGKDGRFMPLMQDGEGNWPGGASTSFQSTVLERQRWLEYYTDRAEGQA